MARETRHIEYPKIPAPTMPSPTNMATMTRMILTALPPPEQQPRAATGWAVATTAAPAADDAPHAVQNCLSGGTSAPHFVQKLAMMVSLMFRSVVASGTSMLLAQLLATRQYTSIGSGQVRLLHSLPVPRSGRTERAVYGRQPPGILGYGNGIAKHWAIYKQQY